MCSHSCSVCLAAAISTLMQLKPVVTLCLQRVVWSVTELGARLVASVNMAQRNMIALGAFISEYVSRQRTS